jgi:hypothetical protein
MAGYESFNWQTVTFGIAHNISAPEEKVEILANERSMEDLSVLSIRSVSSAVGRILARTTHIYPNIFDWGHDFQCFLKRYHDRLFRSSHRLFGMDQSTI